MIAVRRGADRAVTRSDGITSWHCFSSGAHYDPDNVAFGPVIACDEHVLAPGAGFARHEHARVELLSWVLDGALRHTDDAGRVHVVAPGVVQYQRSGPRIWHAEQNASDAEALRFVQLWLLCDEDTSAYSVNQPPLTLHTGRLRVVTETAMLPRGNVFAHVARGRFAVGGQEIAAGDSVRATDEALDATGAGELLVVEFR